MTGPAGKPTSARTLALGKSVASMGVATAADLFARSAPHSRTTPSPAVTMPAERKVGIAPTFFMRSIWSGRM